MEEKYFLLKIAVVVALIAGIAQSIRGSTAESGVDNAYDGRNGEMIVLDITDKIESTVVDCLAEIPEELYEEIEYDVSVENDKVEFALEAILDTKTAIVQSEEKGYYDFPKLEVEHSEISYRTSFLPKCFRECDTIVLAFFPKGIPSMAACAFVSEDMSHVEIYLDSTWVMIKRFETLWGKQRYLWSVEQQYLISGLFEPLDAWTQHLLPSERAVTEKIAQSIAADELKNHGYLPRNTIEDYIVGVEYIVTPKYSRSEEGVWIISYYKQSAKEHELLCSVAVDGITGEVLEIQRNGGGLG